MRAVIQRVSQASVKVDSETISAIGDGLLVFLGVESGDQDADLDYIFRKTQGLRVFEDDQGLMNLSVQDVGGSVLVVSQFTLLGDVRKGKRPSFTSAAKPSDANLLYQAFCQRLRDAGIEVGEGKFQADMQVSLVNDGPVTILLDSHKTF